MSKSQSSFGLKAFSVIYRSMSMRAVNHIGLQELHACCLRYPSSMGHVLTLFQLDLECILPPLSRRLATDFYIGHTHQTECTHELFLQLRFGHSIILSELAAEPGGAAQSLGAQHTQRGKRVPPPSSPSGVLGAAEVLPSGSHPNPG